MSAHRSALFSMFEAPGLSNKLPKAETSKAGLERPITPVITAIGSAYSIELTLELILIFVNQVTN